MLKVALRTLSIVLKTTFFIQLVYIFLLMQIRYHTEIATYLGSHSSEIRNMCLMKSPSKTLQNFKTTHIFLRFPFHATFFPNESHNLLGKWNKFWSILLGNFIKNKPLISIECSILSWQYLHNPTSMVLVFPLIFFLPGDLWATRHEEGNGNELQSREIETK